MVGDISGHIKVYFKNIRSITLVSFTLFWYLFVQVQYVRYALWLGIFLVILKCISRIYEVLHLLAIHSSGTCICSSRYNMLEYALWLGTFLVILNCTSRIYEESHLLAIHSSGICSSRYNMLDMLCGWGHFWSY